MAVVHTHRVTGVRHGDVTPTKPSSSESCEPIRWTWAQQRPSQAPSDTGTVIGGSVVRRISSTTTHLASFTGLARPTMHRLLSDLRAEGLVGRDETTAAWHLGPECFLLGAAANAHHDVTPIARESVVPLARETGESAFLSVIRGDETVCLLREDGAFPIRSHVLYEGIRFPLGVASAGLAVLAFQPERERDAYLARADLVATCGRAHATEPLRRRIADTATRGTPSTPASSSPAAGASGRRSSTTAAHRAGR